MNTKLAYLYIISAAFFWGIIGFFVSYLSQLGFNSTQIVTVRAITAVIFLLIYVTFKNPSLLKIRFVDSKYFIGTGILSIVLFNWCLFQAIQVTSISVATILLYTAPAFVTILSRIFFKESLTKRKVSALAITLLGCSLVVGLFSSTSESISIYGLTLGLGAGLFYALYSIFGKYALQKYDSLTVTVYTFVFAAVAITPFSGIWEVTHLFSNFEVWIYIIGLGFLSTVLSFTLYTKGLTVIESSRASIIATVEPVIAALVGFLVFEEKLDVWQYMGVVLVISAVILVQESAKKRKDKVMDNTIEKLG